VALGVIMLAAIVAACRFKTRLGVIASLSVVGFGTALFFALFSAPDVAMTQFLAETLMLVVLVVAFHHLPTFRTFSSRAARIRDAGIGAVAGGLMAVLAYAAAGARPEKEASRLMLSQSVEEAKGHNVVNVMLVDFRALDTMGETTVLVTAAVGVFALLRGGRRREAWDRLS
jgi:multicomponent Na+:H+ antiporter subunit A